MIVRVIGVGIALAVLPAVVPTTKPSTIPAHSVGKDTVILGDLGMPVGEQVEIGGHKEVAGPLPEVFLVESINGNKAPPDLRIQVEGIAPWPDRTSAELRGCEVGYLRFLHLAETNFGAHDDRWKGEHQVLFLKFKPSKIIAPNNLKLERDTE